MDNGQKQSVIDRLKQANNVLVTVSVNPTVDQLAACIGLTLMVGKLNKHATAVYSGETPSAIGFLEPEKTIEKNTDSLRDFIIALDKSKADKLRYKVEDTMVKIFITPYRSSISEKDLQFSQGDFNVDAVVCLGVQDQKDLDQAITTHGRILHDATVISVSNKTLGQLGTVNWQDANASSLSEMVTSLAAGFDDPNLLDAQIATALLTGIVAETERFGNDKTSPDTLKISALLMAAGANQQLITASLNEPPPPPPPTTPGESAGPAPGADDIPPPPPLVHENVIMPIERPEDKIGAFQSQAGVDATEPQVENKEQPQAEEENKRAFLAGPGPLGSFDSLGLPNSGDTDEKPAGAPSTPPHMQDPIPGAPPADADNETPPVGTNMATIEPPPPSPPLPNINELSEDSGQPSAMPQSGVVPEPPGGVDDGQPESENHDETVSETEKTNVENPADSDQLSASGDSSDEENARKSVEDAISQMGGQGPEPEPVMALNAQPLEEEIQLPATKPSSEDSDGGNVPKTDTEDTDNGLASPLPDSFPEPVIKLEEEPPKASGKASDSDSSEPPPGPPPIIPLAEPK